MKLQCICHLPAITNQTALGASVGISDLNFVIFSSLFDYVTGGQVFSGPLDTLRKCSYRHTQPQHTVTPRMAGLTFVCRDEWTWFGNAGEESIKGLNCQGKESGLALCWGAAVYSSRWLHYTQMTVILSPGPGLTLQSRCDGQ